MINNGFHGYDFEDGEIRLSVLRSAAYCHEQGFKHRTGPARKFMDQGVHDVRLLVTAGDAGRVRRRVPGWPTGSARRRWCTRICRSVSAAASSQRGGSFLRLTPGHVRLLACKQSWDGAGLVVRVQEMAGERTAGELAIADGTAAVVRS